MRIGTRLVALIVTLAPWAARAAVNDSFDDLDAWDGVEGNVTVQSVSENSFAVFREEGSGGLSRIWQEFELPSQDPPSTIEFKYGLFRDRSTRNSPVPPDSFTAFLINPAQSTFLRTLGSQHPAFIRGFLYHDSDGRQLYGGRKQVRHCCWKDPTGASHNGA
jgi:hypothetical protein